MRKGLRIRNIIFYLIVIIVTVLVAANFDQLQKFVVLISQLNIVILVCIIFIRFLYYWANAKYFQSFFGIFKTKKIAFKNLLVITIIMNFINTILPSGGVTGTAYLAKATNKQVSASTATIAQVSWYILTFVSYLIVLVIGFISLFLSKQIDKISFRVVLIIITFLIVTGAVAISIMLNKQLTKKIGYLLIRPVNFMLRRLNKPALNKKLINQFVNEFYRHGGYLLKDPMKLKSAFLYTFLGILLEILSLYSVFLAFNVMVNPGVVVAGYSLAMLSSLAAIFTSGVGVYEAAMVATFVSLGQSFALSLSVALVYRIIAFWLFIPIGLFFYKRQIDGED